MDLYHSRLTPDDLNDLIIKYKIPHDLHPRLPFEDFMMSELLDNAIGIYHRMFDFYGVQIPFSSFLLTLIKHYKVYFSQLGPLGLNKVITFKVLCWSLQIEPMVTLFRVFQTLCKQGDWFSFAKCRAPSPVNLQRLPFYCTPPAAANVVNPDPTPEDLAAGHVAKRTRSALAQSSGSTTRPNLFVGNSDDESDGDDDACVEIPLVTPFCSATMILSSRNQGQSSTTPAAEGSNTRDSQGKGIMVNDAAAPSGGASRLRPSSRPAPSFKDVSDDAIHMDFFPFSAGPYYATYPEGGVTRNCEFTREEWDTPYQPTFGVLTKEVFKDPAVCKIVVDQFPTPGEMVRVESLSDDQLTTKMSVLHCMMMSHGGELLARYRGLNQSHHEYVLSTDSRLKGYEKKVANMTGLELQVAALKKLSGVEAMILKESLMMLLVSNVMEFGVDVTDNNRICYTVHRKEAATDSLNIDCDQDKKQQMKKIRVLLTLLLGSKYLFKYCCAGWIKISVEFHSDYYIEPTEFEDSRDDWRHPWDPTLRTLPKSRMTKQGNFTQRTPQAKKQSDQASRRSPSRHLEAPLRIIGSGLPRRAIPGDKTQQPPQSKHEDTTACCFHHPSSNGARDEYHRAATPTHSKQGSEFRVTTPMEGVATELGD
ncbi:hypothetical protein Tco_1112945 [Tanacetum coccineum]|uniref:Transposase (putative) gypsy type domain-containing protein n=1 Tax=Tanacetum coccineum TaxID=301880 RepID=A0ABQ5IQR5_9ASTR